MLGCFLERSGYDGLHQEFDSGSLSLGLRGGARVTRYDDRRRVCAELCPQSRNRVDTRLPVGQAQIGDDEVDGISGVSSTIGECGDGKLSVGATRGFRVPGREQRLHRRDDRRIVVDDHDPAPTKGVG